MTRVTTIQTVFFWLGGVLTDTVAEAAARGLYDCQLQETDLQTRLYLRQLGGDLAQGAVDGLAFCRNAIEQSGRKVALEDLAGHMVHSTQVRTDVVTAIQTLPDRYEKWLISDYPADWCASIVDRTNLDKLFPDERWIVSSDCHLVRLVPDIFYHLPSIAGRPMECCLMIDGDSVRAVYAVRHGLSSTIFVDAKRLIRDFKLRKMWPPEAA